MQFTEQELNAMYQQQMVAQQAYNHWIATLSLDQQGQLHARMQANMQQVQQAMSALVQNATKNASEVNYFFLSILRLKSSKSQPIKYIESM